MNPKNLFAILILLFVSAPANANPAIAKIEAKYKLHVGVFAMKGNKTFSHRENERFAYCSSFKWVLCSAVLKKVDASELSLNQEVPYQKKDLLAHSPVTEAHVSTGKMTVGDLCAATVQESDNAAANLLSPLVGNLKGLSAFTRSYGDTTMRFDRPEPDLNTNIAGDERDTTTPKAMAMLLKNVSAGPGLTSPSQEKLLSWMKGTTTGNNRIRAGVPKEWTVADKTGTANQGAAIDVAVLFPPQDTPIYVSVFVNGKGSSFKTREAAIAEAAKVVANDLSR